MTTNISMSVPNKYVSNNSDITKRGNKAGIIEQYRMQIFQIKLKED